VAVLLENNRDDIITTWTRALKRDVFRGYSDVPLNEIEAACRQCLSAFVATLRVGDHGKMRRFVHREVRVRLAQGYLASEIDQMLCTLRQAAWPVITAEYAADGSALSQALDHLQHCADQALFELTDYYLSVAQQKAEDHLAEMEAMNRRLEEISIRDALTGLYNRRYFQDRLIHEFQRSQRHRRPMGVLMLDIDHFKRVNDTYGHQAGDEVLRGVGLALINQTRDIDIVARYGGEEFVIVLPETDRAGTLELAERLREHIALVALHHVPADGTPDGTPAASLALRCTVSIGASGYDGGEFDEANHLVGAADSALYHSKGTGRNRVTTSWGLRELARGGTAAVPQVIASSRGRAN
jgi:diguanylate cyclase (GGDEF)-like protein